MAQTLVGERAVQGWVSAWSVSKSDHINIPLCTRRCAHPDFHQHEKMSFRIMRGQYAPDATDIPAPSRAWSKEASWRQQARVEICSSDRREGERNLWDYFSSLLPTFSIRSRVAYRVHVRCRQQGWANCCMLLHCNNGPAIELWTRQPLFLQEKLGYSGTRRQGARNAFVRIFSSSLVSLTFVQYLCTGLPGIYMLARMHNI